MDSEQTFEISVRGLNWWDKCINIGYTRAEGERDRVMGGG